MTTDQTHKLAQPRRIERALAVARSRDKRRRAEVAVAHMAQRLSGAHFVRFLDSQAHITRRQAKDALEVFKAAKEEEADGCRD